MKNFLTNSPHSSTLVQRIEELTSVHTELKFLVGFFYFSGLQELYDSLKNHANPKLKILVGLSVDYISGELAEFAQTNNSDEEVNQNYQDAIVRILNHDRFDNQHFEDQLRFFLQLLCSGSLELRVTQRPNHSKLYLFKTHEKGVSQAFITGSSNLTRPGLRTQNELNVEIKDWGFEEAEEYFDELWQTSTVVHSKALENAICNRTMFKKITPFEGYFAVLNEYIKTQYSELTDKDRIKEILEDKGYTAYSYQIDAISYAKNILDLHSGVILADVVGMGKTVIACALAKTMNAKGGMIICPPGLMGEEDSWGWKKYRKDFRLSHDWYVKSSGKLDEIEEKVRNNENIEIIIIDEAHKFRNQNTESYERLKNICAGKKVMLLSATPYNNKPSDIFSLINLFTIPKQSTITLDPDIQSQFVDFSRKSEALSFIIKFYSSKDELKIMKSKKYYEEYIGSENINIEKVKTELSILSKQIRSIISPVLIRRNRIDLQTHDQYSKEMLNLPTVQDPQEIYFELTSEQNEFYDEILSIFDSSTDVNSNSFIGASYRPYKYKSEISEHILTQQDNLAGFMRSVIIKRLESSFAAFSKTIDSFIRRTKIVIEFVNKHRIYFLDLEFIENKLNVADPEDIVKEFNEKMLNTDISKNKGECYRLDSPDFDEEKFKADLNQDLAIFKMIKKKLVDQKLVDKDPKPIALKDKITQILNRSQSSQYPPKVIIFSEYQDTIKYLDNILRNTYQQKVLTINKDSLNRQDTLTQLHSNFDASYKISRSSHSNKYDILLCTDKLSEGFNLNRANTIINYDIPWNPVRIIQRLGRINRIGTAPHKKLFIFNIFPTVRGSSIVRSREIAGLKMLIIHKILGEDSKIFATDEEPEAANLMQKISSFTESEINPSFSTIVYQEFSDLKKRYPEIYEKIVNLPSKVKTAKDASSYSLYMAINKNNNLYISYISKDSPQAAPITLEDAIDQLRCDVGTPVQELSSHFRDNYGRLKQPMSINLGSKSRTNQNSTIQKALNNLRSYIAHPDLPHDLQLFCSKLSEEITTLGTVSEYTLSRIKKILCPPLNESIHTEALSILNDIKQRYVFNNISKNAQTRNIIIAIENIDHKSREHISREN